MEDAKDWARIKFWESPELLEKMLLHLDSSSILNLTEVSTEVCSVILKILESSSVWGELIRKTCTKDMYELEHAEPISDLGKILSKMGNLQKKKELELDLLHLIVERSSFHLPTPKNVVMFIVSYRLIILVMFTIPILDPKQGCTVVPIWPPTHVRGERVRGGQLRWGRFRWG